ncbi:hypothetical protein [Burkholderia ubonensis]|uniref:hypothetical protein n=1 Tax=Burkholderia ubonensis TaxID=101571 RepID=UPI0012FB23DF|nr:hypothetical protein [Burkholderia ubonensis]
MSQALTMNKYALDTQPSSYYLDQFAGSPLEIQPHREAGRYKIEHGEFVRADERDSSAIFFPSYPERGCCKIKADFFEFEIYVPSCDSRIDHRFIDIAREVLGNIVEMDAAARSLPKEMDYKEYLAYVDISTDEVEFHYISDVVNTEWGIDFIKGDSGSWVLKRFD